MVIFERVGKTCKFDHLLSVKDLYYSELYSLNIHQRRPWLMQSKERMNHGLPVHVIAFISVEIPKN